MSQVYSGMARYYDKLYAGKDYAGEVEKLLSILGEDFSSGGKKLLDVACGTGRHVEYLAHHFIAEGLDICWELLETARERNPGIMFHQGDIRTFSLNGRYDVITCLFSSIGYMKTPDELKTAVGNMAAHLNHGGVLVIEPWFTPDAWKPQTVHGIYVDEPDLKIARINTSKVEGRLSLFDLHHLVGTPEKTEHIVEHHEMGLFEVEEMTAAMQTAGLSVEFDEEGLTGRGLYMGKMD